MKLLTRLLQREHGSVGGAARLAELMTLLEACFSFGIKQRDHWIMVQTLWMKGRPPFALINDILYANDLRSA